MTPTLRELLENRRNAIAADLNDLNVLRLKAQHEERRADADAFTARATELLAELAAADRLLDAPPRTSSLAPVGCDRAVDGVMCSPRRWAHLCACCGFVAARCALHGGERAAVAEPPGTSGRSTGSTTGSMAVVGSVTRARYQGLAGGTHSFFRDSERPVVSRGTQAPQRTSSGSRFISSEHSPTDVAAPLPSRTDTDMTMPSRSTSSSSPRRSGTRSSSARSRNAAAAGAASRSCRRRT